MVVFGGINTEDDYLKSVEVYNAQTQKWKLTNIELSELGSSFGFMTIKSQPWIQIQSSPNITLLISIMLIDLHPLWNHLKSNLFFLLYSNKKHHKLTRNIFYCNLIDYQFHADILIPTTDQDTSIWNYHNHKGSKDERLCWFHSYCCVANALSYHRQKI